MISLPRSPRGGLHPEDRKSDTRGAAVWNAAVPSHCVVPLLQHAGNPAAPVVRPGDRVREGMLIGRAADSGSANVHAPVPGLVRERIHLRLADDRLCEAFVIDLEGEFDRLGKAVVPVDWERKSARELMRAIRECGVVGMSGSGIPVHRKYHLARGQAVDHLIVNGVENEPYLSADHRLMLEMTDGILDGIRIAARILKPRRVTIAIQANKNDAVQQLQRRIRARGLDFALRPVQVNYPQGEERLLARTITGREIATERSTAEFGVMVSNVATLFAMFEAVVLAKPLIERIVTVSGGAIERPANIKVRIGTPVSELIEECGGFGEKPEKVVLGGPMMGHTISDLSTPVTKLTTGLLALTAHEIHRGRRTACIQCGRCVRACPMGLEPTLLYKMLEHGSYDAAQGAGLSDCIECGCCGFTCPAHIPLVDGLLRGKQALRQRKERS